MSATLSNKRTGKFTSSEIYKLMSLDRKGTGFGKPALTYIRQKQYERKLGRSIHGAMTSRATSWGHLNELRAFDMLGTEYSLNSNETLQHPSIDCLCGTPDGFKYGAEKTVIDFKSPFTLGSFCELVDPIYSGLTGIDAINWIRDNHESGDAYYWQLVANSMITGCTHAELVIYCPYERELTEIRLLADDAPAEVASDFYWLQFAYDKELPYLIEGGYYKNINIIRFEVPETDKRTLEYAIEKAEQILNPQPHVLLAHNENGVTIIEAAN